MAKTDQTTDAIEPVVTEPVVEGKTAAEIATLEAARSAGGADPAEYTPKEPSLDAMPDPNSDGDNKGYHTGQWAGHMTYECDFCPYNTTRERDIKDHVTGRHAAPLLVLRQQQQAGVSYDDLGNPVPHPGQLVEPEETTAKKRSGK